MWWSLFATFVAVTSATYDEKLMHFYAELAGAAYKDRADILAWNCSHCVDSTVEVAPGGVRVLEIDELDGDNNATQVIVAKFKNESACFVSFRGSSNVQNWIRNLQIDTTEPSVGNFPECPGCQIHSGFLAIWTNARDDVVNALGEVGCSGGDVYVTGHSLGAALAHLAMFTLKSEGFNIRHSFSFEAPRVGDMTFRKAFSAYFGGSTPVWRLTHDRDPVVHLPPQLLGYEHVATEVFYSYTSDGALQHRVCDDATGEDTTCSWKYYLYNVSQHCDVPFVDSGKICGESSRDEQVVV
jgi:hypothetical protein